MAKPLPEDWFEPHYLICDEPSPFAPLSQHRRFLQSLDRMRDCAQVRRLRERTLKYIREMEANPERRERDDLN
jgi:hypothetical protein